MRLSDAIGLGRTIVKAKSHTVLTKDNSQGCAVGMALVAVGKKYNCDNDWDVNPLYKQFDDEWPWTKNRITMDGDCIIFVVALFRQFDNKVMTGHWTLDQLIDWVRSVEPAEPEIPNTFPVPTFTEIEEYSCT